MNQPFNKIAPPLKAGNTSSRRNGRGVLHLCADLEFGDPSRETVSLAVLTQRLGWRAMIGSAGGPLVQDAERAAVKHTRMPLNRHGVFSNWRNRVHLEALIQREHPALVHVHGHDPIEMGCRISLQHRLPLVVDLTQPMPKTSATQQIVALINQTACTIRVPTLTMSDYLIKTFNINPAVIKVVPPGIDLQSYTLNAVSAERLHNLNRLWRLPETGAVALMPMPIEPHMGHAVLLEALALLKEENIYAIMVGSDRRSPGLRQEIEQSVEARGLSGKVIMPESCPDWPAAFWLSSFVVAPNSAPRGQNMEVLEAQALGRPAIVTAVGANEEMVSRGETAWIIPPDDPKILAAALKEAMHMDTQQRINLASNTHWFVEDTFPQANWFNGMMSVYEALLCPSLVKQASCADPSTPDTAQPKQG